MTLFRRVADSSGDAGAERPGFVVVAHFGAMEAILLRQLALEIMALLGDAGAGGGTGSGTGTGTGTGTEEAAGPGDTSGATGRGPAGGDSPAGDGPAGGGDPAGGDPAGGGAAGDGTSASGESSAGAANGGDADVLGELEQTLHMGDPLGPPDDPALARLLPDAYGDDPEAASEFRRYTEKDLRAGKAAAANTVLATLREQGGQVSLSPDEAEVWLRSLNDMRLALGIRLGITQEMAERFPEVDADDPRYAVFAVYDWLTEMQESLVHAMQ